MEAAASHRSYAADEAKPGIAIGTGVLWGVIAAMAMAMYAMVAGATYLNSGFFTPLYHIASVLISPDAMATSMERASEGQYFYFTLGPAVVGMMVHLVTGAFYGIVFALIARAATLSGAAAVVAGPVYGVAILLFSSFVALPIAAAVLGAGDAIADMPEMVGWATFTIEHMMFGLVLGIGWAAAGRTRGRPEVGA